MRQELLSEIADGAAQRRSPKRFIMLVAAAAVALALSTLVLDEPPAAAGVEIARVNGSLTATVTDPFVDWARLSATFEKHGLDISLRLVPVSPSRIGTIVTIVDDGTSSLFTLIDGPCLDAPDCPIGLRIPLDYRGSTSVTLGRPARDGEAYVSTGNAFDPGEAFDGLRLLGHPANETRVVAAERGITIEWRTVIDKRSVTLSDTAVHEDYLVVGATPLTDRLVLVWVEDLG
ncbi:MAG: hypothetical protein H8E59_07465 [Actinobacteria bacterium]|nr:hypothetical protein [Actinomycetota bacterium]